MLTEYELVLQLAQGRLDERRRRILGALERDGCKFRGRIESRHLALSRRLEALASAPGFRWQTVIE